MNTRPLMRIPFMLAVGTMGLFAISIIGLFVLGVLLNFVPPVTSFHAGIVQVTAGAAILYVLPQAFRLLLKRRAGYHDDEPTPFQSRRVGRPVLLGISFAVAALMVTYSSWWNHRASSREYAHAKGCYAQLQTADRLPGLIAKFAPGDLPDNAAQYLGLAEEFGGKLGMRREAVDQDLRRAAAAYSNSYARLTPAAADRKARLLLGDVIRCVNDDWAPHGELLNP